MSDEQFIQIVKECKTMLFASKKVKMSYSSFKRKAIKLKCYNPNQGGKNTLRGTKISLKDILDGKHPQYQAYKLKIRLIEAGILEDKCIECGWNKKPLGSKYTSCELDHINGNSNDHRLDNIRILCPNCHSLTETYRFRRGKINSEKTTNKKEKLNLETIDIEKRKAYIDSIDVMKFGWVEKVSKEWNISHTSVRRWIKKYYPELKFYERKS